MESKPEVNSGVTGGEAFIATLRNEPEIEIDPTKFTPRHERCPEDKQGRTIQEVMGLSVEDLRTRDFTVEQLKEIGKAYRPWYLLTKHWSNKRMEALLWHRNPEGRNQCAYCLKEESGLDVHHVQRRNSSGEVIYDAYDKLGEEDVRTDLTVLCRECHSRFHYRAPSDNSVFLKDDYATAKVPPPPRKTSPRKRRKTMDQKTSNETPGNGMTEILRLSSKKDEIIQQLGTLARKELAKILERPDVDLDRMVDALVGLNGGPSNGGSDLATDKPKDRVASAVSAKPDVKLDVNGLLLPRYYTDQARLRPHLEGWASQYNSGILKPKPCLREIINLCPGMSKYTANLWKYIKDLGLIRKRTVEKGKVLDREETILLIDAVSFVTRSDKESSLAKTARRVLVAGSATRHGYPMNYIREKCALMVALTKAVNERIEAGGKLLDFTADDAAKIGVSPKELGWFVEYRTGKAVMKDIHDTFRLNVDR